MIITVLIASIILGVILIVAIEKNTCKILENNRKLQNAQ